jgi:phosphonopyruvate decarboxylase
MLDVKAFYEHLLTLDVDFFTGVPDSLLKDICAYITSHAPPDRHIIAANEGGALALGVGYHLATGKVPLIYMQNSGLGNVVNPLLSIADPEVYAIPMLLMIGWRGEPGVKDEPQHVKQGRIMLAMLDAMEMPHYVIDGNDLDAAKSQVRQAIRQAQGGLRPVALIIRKGIFGQYPYQDRGQALPLCREEVIQQIAGALSPRDVVVATTGMPSRELFECRERLAQGHDTDFLMVGGMGHASHVALGIALRHPDRQVVCVDGDGSVLMHMGSLAINGIAACANFKHIVLNNAAHDSVGGQPTVADRVDLSAVARAVGYRQTIRAGDTEEIAAALGSLRLLEGPAFLEVRIRKGARKDLGRPTSSTFENKAGFMKFLRN